LMDCSKAEAMLKMPAAEIHEWAEFWRHEPPGSRRVNHQFAVFAAECCNLLAIIASGLGAKTKPTYTYDGFMGTKTKKQPQRHLSPEVLTTKLRIWAHRANAAFKKKRGKA
jgi:hypothetical protein